MTYASGKDKHFLGATPKDRRNNIFVILLIITLAVLLFLFFSQRSRNRQIISEVTARKDSIQVELTRIIVGYDSLKIENDTLTEQMYFAQTRVKDLLMEVEQTKKISLEKINRYQKEVTTLRDITSNSPTKNRNSNKTSERLQRLKPLISLLKD
jgi:cell division protein FtsL